MKSLTGIISAIALVVTLVGCGQGVQPQVGDQVVIGGTVCTVSDHVPFFSTYEVGSDGYLHDSLSAQYPHLTADQIEDMIFSTK